MRSRPLVALLLASVAVALWSTTGAADPNQRLGNLIPRATVQLQSYESRGATLTPDTLIISGGAGCQDFLEDKILHLPEGVGPAKADILICFDLTGSMGGELNNVKVNSINIMNAVRTLIPDTRFGVISHMDYPGWHQGCSYANQYGASPQDYDYRLDQPVTDDLNAVSAAINALVLGQGWDHPEDYARALYEAYSDPGIGWRADAKKIVLQWGDDIPHDCQYDACIGGSTTSGPDPGRDGLDLTGDDLQILSVLSGMASAGITLVPLHSGATGEYFDLWACYAAVTGGQAFPINPDGSVPGGQDIAAYIVSIIGQTVEHIGTMTLEVCTPGYESWLIGVSPAEYTDLTLDHAMDLPFTITIRIPDGTPIGEYHFDICAMGDDLEYTHQHVIAYVTGASGTERSRWGQVKNLFR